MGRGGPYVYSHHAVVVDEQHSLDVVVRTAAARVGAGEALRTEQHTAAVGDESGKPWAASAWRALAAFVRDDKRTDWSRTP